MDMPILPMATGLCGSDSDMAGLRFTLPSGSFSRVLLEVVQGVGAAKAHHISPLTYLSLQHLAVFALHHSLVLQGSESGASQQAPALTSMELCPSPLNLYRRLYIL